MKKKTIQVALFYIVLIVAAVIAITVMIRNASANDMVYSQIVTAFKEEHVKAFEVDSKNVLRMQCRVYDENGNVVQTTDAAGKTVEKTEVVE